MSPVQFSRKPYKVTYYKDGVKHVINRRPPPKLHDIWPKDEVALNQRKNDDWPEGGVYKVKNISPRQPNTLQLINDDGGATFVPYFDVSVQASAEDKPGVDPRDLPINNRYLLWP